MILYYSSSVDSISPVNPASSIIFIVASIPCPPAVRYPEAKIESTTLNKVGSIPLQDKAPSGNTLVLILKYLCLPVLFPELEVKN